MNSSHNQHYILCLNSRQLTLSNENGIFQVRGRWVVIVHLVCHKNNEPVKQIRYQVVALFI